MPWFTREHSEYIQGKSFIYFIEKKKWYLAFADLSILYLIQSLNGRL